ncbi:hypothetical protein F5141DRAFT_1059656 [Pisolithus sp. B1]|nr:hypothetical protein F5141DRAFT_1059656 [Pisolithus sp. B1]
MRTTTIRACYPRPLTADSSGSSFELTSSQLAHEDEVDAQRHEISKDDKVLEAGEKKRDQEDDDFCIEPREFYSQCSSQSTDICSDSDFPGTYRNAGSIEEEDSDMETNNFSDGSCSGRASPVSIDQRTPEQTLCEDKEITREKIKLIHKALYQQPHEILSPDRRRFAKLLIAILYELTAEETELVDRWIKRNREQLRLWPNGV